MSAVAYAIESSGCFERESIEEISADEMDEVVEEMRALARELHEAEVEHLIDDLIDSPWTCYCEACIEARNRQ